MMTLLSVAVSTGYFYSAAVVFGVRGEIFFWELATLIDIMLLGHWIEMRSVRGASRALEELARLMPDGSAVDIPVEELRAGDELLVKPGEKIPADGEVSSGETSINEAVITGESKPAPTYVGARVIGGSINAEGSITVRVS